MAICQISGTSKCSHNGLASSGSASRVYHVTVFNFAPSGMSLSRAFHRRALLMLDFLRVDHQLASNFLARLVSNEQ